MSVGWSGTIIALNILRGITVEPYEVWEVCEDPLHLARRHGNNRYLVYGQTADGRYLFVVLEYIQGTVYKPITARDMTDPRKTKL